MPLGAGAHCAGDGVETSTPAMRHIGRLRGADADVVVFDAERVGEPAAYQGVVLPIVSGTKRASALAVRGCRGGRCHAATTPSRAKAGAGWSGMSVGNVWCVRRPNGCG
jgi:hypothetical protein